MNQKNGSVSWEDRVAEITAAEQKKERRMNRSQNRLRDLWDNIKRNNIHIIGIPKEKRETNDQRKYLKRL